MAASKTINLLVDCLICGFNRSDRNPRLLPCKHGFCQECLNKTTSMKKERQLQCPVCLGKTQLSRNGVIELEVDTKVSEASLALVALKDNYTCALCIIKGKKKEAIARCTTCEFRLCYTCLEDHKIKEKFSTHAVVETLCKIHFRDISHACLTCRGGMCYECMLSGFHDDHATCDITEVKEKAAAMMVKGKSEIKLEIESADKLMNKTMDESMTLLNQRRKQTEEKLEEHRKKMMEAITSCLDKREEEFNRLVTKALGDQNEACSKASNCLNEIDMVLEEGKVEILEQLTKKTNDIFRSLDTLRTTKEVPIRIPKLEEDECSANTGDDSPRFGFTCTLGRVDTKTTLEKKPTKVLELSKLGGKDTPIKYLYFIAASDDGSAVLGLSEEKYAVQINLRGDILAEFHTQSGRCVSGLDISKGSIFILSRDPLTVSRFEGSQRQVIDLRDRKMNGWDLVVDDGSFLYTYSAKVYRHSPEGILQQTFGKDKGYRISVAVHPVSGKVYLLSAGEVLYVFKPDGELIRTIGETGTGKCTVKFQSISGCTMLPNNHLLVTDQSAHKVTEVTFEGKFIRHLLTEENGMKMPTDVSFNYPYLWVACREMLFLFKYPEL